MGSGGSAKRYAPVAANETQGEKVPCEAPAGAASGFRTVLPNGSRPGTNVRVKAPDGSEVSVQVPDNYVDGRTLWVQLQPPDPVQGAAAVTTREDELVSLIRSLEKDAETSRDVALAKMENEVQVQMVVWSTAADAALAESGVSDAEADSSELAQTQAIVLAAATHGDAAQLLAALAEAKKLGHVVAASLEEAVQDLRATEEAMLTWRCLRQSIQSKDKHEIRVWLEQANGMGFELPEGAAEFLESLSSEEQEGERSGKRGQRLMSTEERLKFAQEAGDPELLAQMEAEVAAERLKEEVAATEKDQPAEEKPGAGAPASGDKEQPGKCPEAAEERKEEPKPGDPGDGAEQQAEKTANGEEKKQDARSTRELLEECRQRGLDTTGCKTKEDLLDLLQQENPPLAGDASGKGNASSGEATATTPRTAEKPVEAAPPATARMPPSVWDRLVAPAHCKVHQQYETLYLLGFDVLKLQYMPTGAELRSAYRKAAMESHPDKSQNHDRQTEAKELFQKVKDAFDYLSELTT
eukprot:TRINITY_DN76529_c0_g1_i1.p1 TRINITY_DN76529_c0_g1~~TRINITY_DN76529_c0_g1_i1.p1  ORF type:complete len:525 (+),score=180.88 TRINITY_DN76529_c0_g1_i1:47-1621(+)